MSCNYCKIQNSDTDTISIDPFTLSLSEVTAAPDLTSTHLQEAQAELIFRVSEFYSETGTQRDMEIGTGTRTDICSAACGTAIFWV